MFTRMKKTLLCVTAVLFSSVMVGCASQPEQAGASTNKQIEAELAEWRKLKPGVQRLVAIEGELKGLLATLETITDDEPTAQLAVAEPSHNVQAEVLTPVHFEEKKFPVTAPVQMAAAPAIKTAVSDESLTAEHNSLPVSEQNSDPQSLIAAESETGSVSFSLQLASVTKEEAVDPTWVQLKKRHPEVLGQLDFHSEQVLVANRTYYRVKAGRFDSYNEAKQSCKLLMSSGASCIVNKG